MEYRTENTHIPLLSKFQFPLHFLTKSASRMPGSRLRTTIPLFAIDPVQPEDGANNKQ